MWSVRDSKTQSTPEKIRAVSLCNLHFPKHFYITSSAARVGLQSRKSGFPFALAVEQITNIHFPQTLTQSFSRRVYFKLFRHHDVGMKRLVLVFYSKTCQLQCNIHICTILKYLKVLKTELISFNESLFFFDQDHSNSNPEKKHPAMFSRCPLGISKKKKCLQQ